MVIFAKQCAEQIVGCSDLSDIFVVDTEIGIRIDGSTTYSNRVLVYVTDPCADTLNGLKKDSCISDVRYVFYCDFLVGHDCSGKYSKCGILSTRNGNFALQRTTSLDNILFHISPLR